MKKVIPYALAALLALPLVLWLVINSRFINGFDRPILKRGKS